MAGHSKFANIKHRKAAQDGKRTKIFSKIVREIVVAVKQGGPDAGSNPRLRGALQSARAANLPKDRIESAIKKASGADSTENYEEARYEGYGPAGIAVIIDALTDNRNRTVSEIRSAFSKAGGNLGETGSVGFMFDRVGFVQFKAEIGSADDVLEQAIEAGAEDVESDETYHTIYCDSNDFNTVRDYLVEKYGDPEAARLSWKPNTTTQLGLDQARSLFKMVDVLEDNDDVQYVTTNVEVSDEVAQALAEE